MLKQEREGSHISEDLHSVHKMDFFSYQEDAFLKRGSGAENEIKGCKVLKKNHINFLSSYWLKEKEPSHGAEPHLGSQQSLVTTVIFAFLIPIYNQLLALKISNRILPFSFLILLPNSLPWNAKEIYRALIILYE